MLRRHRRHAVQSRTRESRTTAPRTCWRVTSGSALQGLDDRRLVLGAQRALDGEQLGVEQLVEAVHQQAPPLLLGELVEVALDDGDVERAVLLELDAAE